MLVWEGVAGLTPGAETWFSYSLSTLKREHRHPGRSQEASLLQLEICTFKTVSHQFFLFGVNLKLNNCSKEEMIGQSLFEVTNETSKCKG